MTTIITVRNLKYAAFASEETHCFEATVYVDGKPFCKAKNDGHGGCDMYWSIKRGEKGHAVYDQIAEVDKRIKKERADEWKTTTRADGSTFEHGPDFECAVSDAVAEALYLKDMKGAFRKNTLFTTPAKKGIFQYSNGRDDSATMTAFILGKNPDAVILNNLPEAEALVIFKSGNR